MNVNELIPELEYHGLVGIIPDGHPTWRREQEHSKEHGKLIEKIEPFFVPSPEIDHGKGFPKNPNFGAFICIPEGDIKLPEIDIDGIKGKVAEEGIEALAWYRSFHWEPLERWGIYIWDKGIYYIAFQVLRGVTRVSRFGRSFNTLDLLQQSFKLLFLHEFFHFITDLAATILEMGNPQPKPCYIPYVKNVYMRPRDSNEPIEEALANAYALNKVIGLGIRSQLCIFMKNQPNGYSAFDQYMRKDDFTYGRRLLGTCIRDGIYGGGDAPLEMVFDCNYREVGFGDVPIYIVQTISDPRYAIHFIPSIPKATLVLTDRFRDDLQNLPPKIRKKFEKSLCLLEHNIRHPSLNFEKIQGCNTVFSIRIDGGYRASLRLLNGGWELLRITNHEELYRNPGGC